MGKWKTGKWENGKMGKWKTGKLGNKETFNRRGQGLGFRFMPAKPCKPRKITVKYLIPNLT